MVRAEATDEMTHGSTAGSGERHAKPVVPPIQQEFSHIAWHCLTQPTVFLCLSGVNRREGQSWQGGLDPRRSDLSPAEARRN